MDIIKPNFLIVGAAKCGTTSLHHYLKQHHQVYIPQKKETLFMISTIYESISNNDPRRHIAERIIVNSFDDYLRLFSDAKGAKAIGESSATYLYYYDTAIPNIKNYLGDPKIIIILRNPIDRAYSAYYHLVRDGVESLPFENYLQQEEKRKKENWDILNLPVSAGMYFNQVREYINNFTQVKILVLDELKNDPSRFMQNVYNFLQINEKFIPDTIIKYNQSKTFGKHNKLDYLLSQNNFIKKIVKSILGTFVSHDQMTEIKKILINNNTRKRPKMKTETHEYLKSLFKDDILKLQDIIDQDVSYWLK